MRATHWMALAALGATTFGSLGVTLGYALYLRSGWYRDECARRLSAAIDLPSEIGSVVPRSRVAREFRDIRVWLPSRRDEALTCRQATVMNRPTRAEPDAWELDLFGGACEISTRTWLREDYRFVLESGLRPGFDPQGPRRVTFGGMDLTFEREPFRAALSGAGGVVLFDSRHEGRATIVCREFNGYTAQQAFVLTAVFTPRERGIRLDQVELTVPDLPLYTAGLDRLVGATLGSGMFHGRLVYAERDDGNCLTLEGHVFDVQLAECTPMLEQPWRGTCAEVQLQELTLHDRRPQRLRFRGVLSGLVLADILAPLGLGNVGGDLTLRVNEADLSASGIDRLVALGRCENVDLEKLTAGLGMGRMRGTASLVIRDLTIEQNRLTSADLLIRVAGAEGEPNWIEGRLLTELLSRALKIAIPPVLPERIEYVQIGARLEVRDEQLRVFGTHGEQQQALITLRLFGRDLPINEPRAPLDLRPSFDALRQRLAQFLAEHLR